MITCYYTVSNKTAFKYILNITYDLATYNKVVNEEFDEFLVWYKGYLKSKYGYKISQIGNINENRWFSVFSTVYFKTKDLLFDEFMLFPMKVNEFNNGHER